MVGGVRKADRPHFMPQSIQEDSTYQVGGYHCPNQMMGWLGRAM